MTIINTNSISGINSITAQGASGVAFYDSSGVNQRLNITSAGNVGINETNPGGLLQVGSSSASHVIITANTGIDINDGAINLYQATSNVNATPFIISTDVGGTETEKLRVTAGGNVGIGDDDPSDALTVYKTNTGNPTGITIRNTNAASTYSHARLRLESQNGAAYGEIWADVANAGLRLGYNSSSTVKIDTNGNIVFGNGKGIDFSATGDATGMTNELLDDYEEGTYTVVMSDSGSGTITVSTSNDQAQYVKVGNLVTVSGRPLVGSKSSPTGDLKISLPFVPAALTEAAERSPASLYIRLCESGSNINNFQASLSSTAFLQFGYASGTDHVASGARVKVGTQIWFSVTYRTA